MLFKNLISDPNIYLKCDFISYEAFWVYSLGIHDRGVTNNPNYQSLLIHSIHYWESLSS